MRVRTAVVRLQGWEQDFYQQQSPFPKRCFHYWIVLVWITSSQKQQMQESNNIFVTAKGKDALVDYFDRAPAQEARLKQMANAQQGSGSR